jgi:hypothetical protein
MGLEMIPIGEVSLKKILAVCMLALIIMGCSAADPTISESTLSGAQVVTGQRILAQVVAISDNPPFTYHWTADGGTLTTEDTLYAALWIAPETPGTYTITCDVSDSENKHATRAFTVTVIERQLNTIMGSGVLTITKQIDSKIGGIWASIQDNYIRYLASSASEDTIWKKNFHTMIARMNSDTLDYTFWGVESGKQLIELSGTSETDLTCDTCTDTDTIHAMAQDYYNTSILIVAADSGLHYYNPDATTPWGTYLTGVFYDLFEGSSAVYAASDSGLYEISTSTTHFYTGDTCAVCTNEDSTTAWTVVDVGGVKEVEENGVALPSQPPSGDVICSLDIDPIGNIWCGKYWWDGTTWHMVPGLDTVTIVKSIASNEGLIYLLSDSGALYRW